MLFAIFASGCILFILAYRFYGRFLERALNVDKKEITPAHNMRDRIDYDPTPPLILFGHHFSAIAGSGPILGPIIAGLAFGWGPAILWIIIGCIFLGAPYDFTTLITSIRNKGKSLGEIGRSFMGTFSYKIFLSFLLIVIIYIITVFVDITAETFSPDNKALAGQGGVVATASTAYMFLAVALGLARRHTKGLMSTVALIAIPILVFVSTILANYIHFMPDIVPPIKGDLQNTWTIILLFYCILASALPVWFLLQPRDYLSSYLLYACLIGGFIGIIWSFFTGSNPIQYPAFIGVYDKTLGPIFPILFVTIACGAISGFHGLVASGTTSKQIDKITQARPIGYGGMLLEGVLALLSLSTVMILSKHANAGSPPEIFAKGLGSFLGSMGLPPTIVATFALLAISTFVLTTLDAATRLGRFLLQELFNISNSLPNRILSSLIIVSFPAMAVFLNPIDIPLWKATWPAFGATNQLLAALGLFFLFLCIRKKSKKTFFIGIPMVIMFIITICAMVQLVIKNCVHGGNHPVAVVSAVLLLMTTAILYDAIRKLFTKNDTDRTSPPDASIAK